MSSLILCGFLRTTIYERYDFTMNKMYADRAFLLVPYMADIKFTHRLVTGNRQRKYPFDLWFIDKRTLKEIPDYGKVDCKAYAYYLPTRECPVDYRALGLWFALWSVKMMKYADKDFFTHADSGLAKLIGCDRENIPLLKAALEKYGLLISADDLFALTPFEERADWFLPLLREKKAPPADFLAKVAAMKNKMLTEATQVKPMSPTAVKCPWCKEWTEAKDVGLGMLQCKACQQSFDKA